MTILQKTPGAKHTACEAWEEKWAGGPRPIIRQSILKRTPSSTAGVLISAEDEALLGMKWRKNRGGYYLTTLHKDGERYDFFLHRIIAFRMFGVWLSSADIVDHINRDRCDNRRSNLRIVGPSENRQNNQRRGNSGATKVGNKWQAQISLKGKFYYLGLHETREVAVALAEEKRLSLGFIK